MYWSSGDTGLVYGGNGPTFSRCLSSLVLTELNILSWIPTHSRTAAKPVAKANPQIHAVRTLASVVSALLALLALLDFFGFFAG